MVVTLIVAYVAAELVRLLEGLPFWAFILKP